jgi:hypothetical protein
MPAVAQRFFDQFDAFNGALTLRSQLGAAEGEAQFFQARVVTTGLTSRRRLSIREV